MEKTMNGNLKILKRNQSKLTVMILAVTLFGVCASPGGSIKIYSTGLDDQFNPLTTEARDPHYVIVSAPAGTEATPFAPYVVSTNDWPLDGAWRTNDSFSQWVGVQPRYSLSTNSDDRTGTYVYQTKFDLTDFYPDSARLTFRLLVDDSVTDVQINGASTGFTFSPNGESGFWDWSSPFEISTNFIQGTNTLEFFVRNDSRCSGLRVEISGTASTTPVARIYQAVEIEWYSKTTTNYLVQWATNLSGPVWSNLNGVILGSGGTTSVFDRVTAPQKFYRVVETP